MNPNDIKLNAITYKNSVISYRGTPLIIKFPAMYCESGIEKYFDKYQITLRIPDGEFLEFLTELEKHNNSKYSEGLTYHTNIFKTGDDYYIKLKIPFRYKKIETTISCINGHVYLPTSGNVKKGCIVQCEVHAVKSWLYNERVGILLEVKNIDIISSI